MLVSELVEKLKAINRGRESPAYLRIFDDLSGCLLDEATDAPLDASGFNGGASFLKYLDSFLSPPKPATVTITVPYESAVKMQRTTGSRDYFGDFEKACRNAIQEADKSTR